MRSIVSLSITAAALSMLALGTAGTASARMMEKPMEGRGGGHEGGHGRMMEMGGMDKMDGMMDMCMDHADKMGLTEEQVVKMKPLHREMQKKDARFKADLKIAEIELMEIMEVKDFDLDKAGSAVKKISDIKMAHRLEMLKGMKEVRALLTDEQFKKMGKMMSIMPMKEEHKRPMKKMGK
jgi:Spy/CpxP family protein refolding chaperone